MHEALSAILWGVPTFSLLIVLHEGGHFAVARAFGVKVHEFMLGLPGPALRFRGGKTTYGVTAIPLGGYVRISGMEPGPQDPLLGSALEFVIRVQEADANGLSHALDIDMARAETLLLADGRCQIRVIEAGGNEECDEAAVGPRAAAPLA